MGFRVGDRVALAGHGAAVVREVVVGSVDGVDRQFVVLSFPDATIRMPVDSEALADLDSVVGPGGVDGVLAVLAAPDGGGLSGSWAERYSAYMIRLGVPPAEDYDGPQFNESARVAEVVGSLTRRQGRDGGLSPGERRLLRKARGILALHLAVHRDIPVPHAESLVDNALAEAPDNRPN
nr:hypothetical protein [Micromonospora sp. DSM 115978]